MDWLPCSGGSLGDLAESDNIDWLQEELLDSDDCSGVPPDDLAETESIDWLLEALQGSGVPPGDLVESESIDWLKEDGDKSYGTSLMEPAG